MCGRFASTAPAAALAEHFAAEPVAGVDDTPRYNVAPTDAVLAVAPATAGRRLGTMSWGLVPRWAPAARRPRRLVNLRAETVAARPAFRRALERRRCIVPADGFYEWAGERGAGPRQPVFVAARDRRPLAFAGVWDVWRGGAGAGPAGGEVRSCAVLTTAPNELVAPVHDRMPAILRPEHWDVWLDPAVADADALAALLRPYPADLLELWPVSTAVNSVRNDGPELVEPVVHPSA